MSAREGGTRALQRAIPGADIVSAAMAITPAAPSTAREAMRDLRRSMHPDELGTLQLVVSELVTNAYLHGPRRGTLEVAAGVADDRVEVRVTSPRGENVPRPAPVQEDALGLQLVELVSESWGVDTAAETVTVWSRICLSGEPAHS